MWMYKFMEMDFTELDEMLAWMICYTFIIITKNFIIMIYLVAHFNFELHVNNKLIKHFFFKFIAGFTEDF